MFNLLFSDVAKAGAFGHDRDVAVHLAKHFNVFDNIVAVSLQTAVEIVQFDARHHPCGAVVKLCRQCFGNGVVAFFLPPTDQIVAVFGNHAVEFGQLVGRILKVSIHRYHYTSGCALKARIERCAFAVVSQET